MTQRKTLTKNPVVEQSVLVVGVDVGYGVTKAVYEDQAVKFPSVAAYARPLKFQQDEISAKHPGEWMTEGSEEWFVGDLAIQQTKAAEQIQLQGRDGNEEANMQFRLRMVKVALAKLFPHYRNNEMVRIILATGLPVDHMSDAAAMKKAFAGQFNIDTTTANFTAVVEEVIVMPQPYGTIYSYMFTPEGTENPQHNIKRIAVADFGRFTVDLAYDDNGDYIDPKSGSRDSGMYMVEQSVSDAYMLKYGVRPSYRDVQEIIEKGSVTVSGETVSFVPEQAEALRAMRNSALALMGQKWDKGLEIHRILVAGGGASSAIESVKKAYRQAVLVPNAQISNAIGYRNYAKYMQNNPD
jgi:hypothetical protein